MLIGMSSTGRNLDDQRVSVTRLASVIIDALQDTINGIPLALVHVGQHRCLARVLEEIVNEIVW